MGIENAYGALDDEAVQVGGTHALGECLSEPVHEVEHPVLLDLDLRAALLDLNDAPS